MNCPGDRTHDPYRVWISEIMLQQTRVEAVIGYYERFLTAYPTVQQLAEAPLDAVLKLWEGLGYYSRAKNLQRAAQQIVARGGFPEEYAEILKLAGVGEYTAGAIWSIAYNKPAAAVDGNVLRVISRLYALEGDITEDRSRKAIRDIVQEHIPGAADYEHGPSAYTQSLMELGAMVCIPGNPRCAQCPLREDCLAYRQGRGRRTAGKKEKRTAEGGPALHWNCGTDEERAEGSVDAPQAGLWASGRPLGVPGCRSGLSGEHAGKVPDGIWDADTTRRTPFGYGAYFYA